MHPGRPNNTPVEPVSWANSGSSGETASNFAGSHCSDTKRKVSVSTPSPSQHTVEEDQSPLAFAYHPNLALGIPIQTASYLQCDHTHSTSPNITVMQQNHNHIHTTQPHLQPSLPRPSCYHSLQCHTTSPLPNAEVLERRQTPDVPTAQYSPLYFCFTKIALCTIVVSRPLQS